MEKLELHVQSIVDADDRLAQWALVLGVFPRSQA